MPAAGKFRWDRLGRGPTRAIVLTVAAVGALGVGIGTSAHAAPTSNDTIRIGVIAPFTGNESYIGPGLMTGVKAAVAQINAAGGVNGKKLSPFTVDDAGDPVTAVTAYRKMLSVDKPAVIIGSFSWTNAALLPLVGRTAVPDFMLGGMRQLNKVTKPYFWRPYPSDSQQGVAHAYYANSKGWKTAAFAYATTASAQTLKAPTRAAFVANGGKIVADVNLVPNASSYRSAILKLRSAKPEVVFFEMDPQTAGTFFRQASQFGFNTQTQWVGTDTEYSVEVFRALGSKLATTNLVFTSGALQGGRSGLIFRYWNKKVNNLSTPGISAANGYDAVLTAALAMQATGSTNGAVFNKKITQVSNPPGTRVYGFVQGKQLLARGKKINYEGVATSVDFDRWHNVIGPWGVFAFTKSGGFKTITTISARQIAAFARPVQKK